MFITIPLYDESDLILDSSFRVRWCLATFRCVGMCGDCEQWAVIGSMIMIIDISPDDVIDS